MGKDDQAYFLHRAAEEMAAAERAVGAAAASAHRELSLRYSLRLILPGTIAANDETRSIGMRRPASPDCAPVPPKHHQAKRRQG
jgi:hypothetical protein